MTRFRGKRIFRQNSLSGKNLGGAMADSLKTIGHAYRADEDVPTEDETGLIPSDKFVQALGNSLEARGFKRL